VARARRLPPQGSPAARRRTIVATRAQATAAELLPERSAT
jgi:hypothetical protein